MPALLFFCLSWKYHKDDFAGHCSIYIWDSVWQNHPSNGPYASYIRLSIIKLLGTELLISHIHFNASVTFLLLVLENLIKYHKGDFAGHCSIYYIHCMYIYNIVQWLISVRQYSGSGSNHKISCHCKIYR